MYLVLRASEDTISKPVVVSAESKKDAIRKMKDNYNALKKEYENDNPNDNPFEVDATSFVNDNADMPVVNTARSGNQYGVVSEEQIEEEEEYEEESTGTREEL